MKFDSLTASSRSPFKNARMLLTAGIVAGCMAFTPALLAQEKPPAAPTLPPLPETLKLSATQKTKITELLTADHAKNQEVFKQLSDANMATRDKVDAVLTPEQLAAVAKQRTKLDKSGKRGAAASTVTLDKAPVTASLPKLPDEVKLTDEQKTQIQALLDAEKEKTLALVKQISDYQEATRKQVASILTPAQRAELDKQRSKTQTKRGERVVIGGGPF
jgi:Spy/CpxP family protein refolding chaperone